MAQRGMWVRLPLQVPRGPLSDHEAWDPEREGQLKGCGCLLRPHSKGPSRGRWGLQTCLVPQLRPESLLSALRNSEKVPPASPASGAPDPPALGAQPSSLCPCLHAASPLSVSSACLPLRRTLGHWSLDLRSIRRCQGPKCGHIVGPPAALQEAKAARLV